MSIEIKKYTEDIVGYLGGKDAAIQFLELEKLRLANEILIIEMMIAKITGVN